MSWQDIVVTIGNIVFVISLIPQVYHGFKEKNGPIKFQTSGPTFFFMYVFVAVYYSLQLYSSAIVAFFVGTMWLILFIQRLIYKK